MKKIDYINIMEKVLDAYSEEHIESFFDEVKENGISEHGFPRLTANIGILLCYGKKFHLKNIFKEMMDYTCENLSTCKKNMARGGGNEFSVREICFCIKEIENAKIFSEDDIQKWKEGIKKITIDGCYRKYAKTPDEHIFNWALFAAVSEQARKHMGLASEDEFIDIQIPTQLKNIDKNGMYKDADTHPPIVYDLVPRGLFAFLLTIGYEGKYKKDIENLLEKSAPYTLYMQSVTGEIPFGGRSNQFYHNETWLCALCEYYASKYQKDGDLKKASQYKRAATLAFESVREGLKKERITHIKNNFDITSSFGCEEYAYFDKYMVTAASFFYMASLMCDENIEEGIAPCEDESSYFMEFSEDFLKCFLKCKDYTLQIDLSAHPHYDASGIGRVHKRNAPSAICLSVPASGEPNYKIITPNPHPMSLCAGYFEDGNKVYAIDESTKYEITKHESTKDYSMCELLITFEDGKTLKETITIKSDGVYIEVCGQEEILFMLPAIKTDGQNNSNVTLIENTLNISFLGHNCTYKTDGIITAENETVANRNGIYYVYEAKGKDHIKIKVEID